MALQPLWTTSPPTCETAAAVAELAGPQEGRWMFCYRSAGHTPEGWLKPDFVTMPRLREGGFDQVLIASVRFLANRLVLFGVDVGAREQAQKAGIESLNATPLFIKPLAAVVQDALAGPAEGTRRSATFITL